LNTIKDEFLEHNMVIYIQKGIIEIFIPNKLLMSSKFFTINYFASFKIIGQDLSGVIIINHN